MHSMAQIPTFPANRRSMLPVLGLLGVVLGMLVSDDCRAAWPDEITEGPIVCKADFSLRQSGQLLDELRQIQSELQRVLAIEPPSEPVHLFLFARPEGMRRYLDKNVPGLPQRRALFLKAGGPGMVFAHRGVDFEIDVRHETTHAFLHASLALVPLWLDEGLAEYFEEPAERRAGDNPHLALIRSNARLGYTPDLQRLEQFRDVAKLGQVEYRDSWAWVHFLFHGPPEARDELVKYLGDIRRRTPPGELSPRLRDRVPNLERRFREHFVGWRE